MQISIPDVPDKLTYAVAAALGFNGFAVVVAGLSGLVFGGLAALALAGATYWYVYRNLAGDTRKAALAAMIIAAVQAFFALIAISWRLPLYFVLDAAMAGCLGYAWFELKKRQPV